MKRILVVVFVTVGTLATLAGPRASADIVYRATANDYKGKNDCGGPATHFRVIGAVTFERSSASYNTLDVHDVLNGAPANTTFSVRVLVKRGCTLIAHAGTITTDGRGNANKWFHVQVATAQSYFFVDNRRPNTSNQTTTVKVAGQHL